VRVSALALVLVSTGCGDASPFVCEAADDCAAAGGDGACEASGYCSFPDGECPSGRRYGSHAPADIAGSCVPPDVADDTSATDPTADDAELDGPDDDGEATTIVTTAGATTSALDDSGSSTASTLTDATLDSSATEASSDSGPATTTDTEPFDVEYVATIAVCTADTVFDPVDCAVQAGVDEFTVDLADDDALVATGWVRFDLDDTLAGAEVTSAEVVFTIGPGTGDGSLSACELWTSEAFDLDTLASGNPSTLELIGDSPGPVRIGAEVVWSVPAELVMAGESLHLALVPISTDGHDIKDASSATPPRLVITAQ